jgi:hypothetical protein
MRVPAIGLVVLVLSATIGSADLLYPAALTFEPGYAIGPPGFPFLVYPEIGDPLTIVGRVALAGEPFDDLLPPGIYELTYVYDGFTCWRAGIAEDLQCIGSNFGDFDNGAVAIYLDVTPDADFADLATFRDGDLVLWAEPSAASVADFDPTGCPWLPEVPDVVAWFTFVGGLWFDRVNDGGRGFQAMSNGELDGNVPPELQSIGYIFRTDGIVDIYAPVAVKATTWGAVKALYR